MVLSSPLRQPTALRVGNFVCRKCLNTPKAQRRRIHSVPTLTHEAHFQEHGVPGMMSPEGFDIAWTQYQGYVVDKLNRLTVGTPDENSITKNILLKYARSADHASLFNHASMAHNNHLFFSAISPDPPEMSSTLADQVAISFSSHESLRATFLATANAMFGPGFVWLVKKNEMTVGPRSDSLAILTTYNAGSPYPGAHFRQQPIDMATTTSAITGNTTPAQFQAMQAAGSAGIMGQHSRNDRKSAPGGAELDVLLGVSTWEHVWLRDWGVGGKRGFLEAWWERIDWGVVEELAGFSAQRKPRSKVNYGR